MRRQRSVAQGHQRQVKTALVGFQDDGLEDALISWPRLTRFHAHVKALKATGLPTRFALELALGMLPAPPVATIDPLQRSLSPSALVTG